MANAQNSPKIPPPTKPGPEPAVDESVAVAEPTESPAKPPEPKAAKSKPIPGTHSVILPDGTAVRFWPANRIPLGPIGESPEDAQGVFARVGEGPFRKTRLTYSLAKDKAFAATTADEASGLLFGTRPSASAPG